MSPRITHSKVSGKPNPTDASKVGGEDWDADHVIDGLTIGTDVQAHDTTLDALAAFDSNGILVQYGTDQFTARTLTGTANEITVTNGAGASGNPTFSLPSALTFTGKTVTGGTFNDILSMTAHTAGATASTVAATARLAKFYDGSSGTPVTSTAPSFSISRYDTSHITAGVYPSALFVETVGQNTSSAHGVAPLNAATFRATQNGDGDVLGVGVEVTGNGGNNYYAYGYFYNVWAKVAAQAAYGIEGIITNDSASAPYSAGATNVYFAHLNLGVSGAYNTTAGIHLWQGIWSRKHDVGLLGGINSVASALVWDDTSAVTSYKDTGTHTDGIDLTGATYSGSAIKSTGFSVSNIGGVTAASLQTAGVLAVTAANADVELGSTSASGTPFIDFHSSGNNIDYDARIIASGGTGVAGNGTLTVTAATLALPGVTTIGGIQAVSISASQTLTNKSMSGSANTFTNIPIGSAISGLGTGVATALGVNVGSAGAFVTFNGALGTPSSGTLTSCTGLPVSTGISGLGTDVATALASGVREKLTASRTYYVRTDGSDSNNGLANTSGGAFLTIQKAIDTAVALDLATYSVTINVADGTYTGAVVLKRYVGVGPIYITGNTGTPSNVVISTTSADAISGTQCGTWQLAGMKIQTTTAGQCVNITGGFSSVTLNGVYFGACAESHIIAQQGANVTVSASYTISGNAVGQHYYCLYGAKIYVVSGITVTLSGTPSFGVFAMVETTGIWYGLPTFSGSASAGTYRYSATLNGVINTYGSGASYFPGGNAGVTATGGQYA